MFKPGKPVHPASGIGTAPDAATTPEGAVISFDRGPNSAKALTIQIILTNLEPTAGNNLEVSFADGKNGTFFVVLPRTTIYFDITIHRCRLRGASGGTAAYSIMGIVA